MGGQAGRRNCGEGLEDEGESLDMDVRENTSC